MKIELPFVAARRFAFLPWLAILATPTASMSQAGEGLELTWKIPHDSAARYEIYDAASAARTGEFWLLGCELTGRVGAIDANDLPLRFLFRIPDRRVRPGDPWPVKEFVFGDAQAIQGVSPVQVEGRYLLKSQKRVQLDEILRAAGRPPKEKSASLDVLQMEGQFQLFRCNWVAGRPVPAEKRASATLSTLTLIRPDDGAILGGKYRASGRAEVYDGRLSGPKVGDSSGTFELILREPLIRLSKEGLSGAIARAIERGSKWLLAQQAPDGRFSDKQGYPVGTAFAVGSTAMALQALLHSGVAAADPAIRKGFAYLGSKKSQQSYDLALLLMALETKYLPMPFLEDLEKYTEQGARDAIRKGISREDFETASAAARTVMETQGPSGLFGYTKGAGYPNFSSTQYAILGLKSAARMGVHVPPSVWRKTLDYLCQAVMKSGRKTLVTIELRTGSSPEQESEICGWGYVHPMFPWPASTMTAGALSTLAVCSSELAAAPEWTERDRELSHGLTWGGLAWLQDWYSPRAPQPEGCGDFQAMPYYYLYGLERAAILWNLKKLGDHDWYFEGAGVLLSWQKSDGSWQGPHGAAVIDTAWALLFLRRATIPVATHLPTPSVDTSKKEPGKEPKPD